MCKLDHLLHEDIGVTGAAGVAGLVFASAFGDPDGFAERGVEVGLTTWQAVVSGKIEPRTGQSILTITLIAASAFVW